MSKEQVGGSLLNDYLQHSYITKKVKARLKLPP